MRQRDIIVIGGSAGSIEVLRTVVAALPGSLPAALFVVVHLSADSPNLLPDILARSGPLPVVQAEDQAPIRLGHIYVAPPDHHLLLEAGWMRVTYGPKENRSRPAVDPLFRSAAYAFGTQVLGVVLSGLLDDGTAGLWAIKDRGGLALVQEPSEALYPSMPQSALRAVAVDYRLRSQEMAALLARLVHEPPAEKGAMPMSDALAIETRIALAENPLLSGVLRLGQPSLYTCPACHGVLVQIEEGDRVRFRCHTGHAYSPATLLAEVEEGIEQGLWSAVRIMEEKIFLLRHLARQGSSAPDSEVAQRLLQQAADVEQRAQRIRQLVLNPEATRAET